MKLTSLSFVAFAFTALVAGCNGGGATSADEEQLAADGTEAMISSTQSTHLASLVFESVSQMDPTEAAAQVGGSSTAPWPSVCVTRAKDTADPHVAHVTFKDCTGPFGLVHLNGGETVTFSANVNGKLHAAIDGVNLTADGKPITFSATADITVNGATRHVVWQGDWSKENDKGVMVADTSDLTLDVDTTAGCRTANGNAKTTVGGREVDSTVDGYVICRNPDGEETCPDGKVTHTGKISRKSVTIAFNGSPTAAVTGPGGSSFHVSLVCPAATAHN